MEVWDQGYLSRKSCFLLQDGVTVTSENILRRDPRNQLVTSGYANDLTSTTIRIILNADSIASYTGTVSRIAILNHNLKQFIVSQRSNIASTAGYLALTSTCQTTTASWNANSMTSHYLAFSAINVTDLYIFATKTMVANSEKAIGCIYMASNVLTFPVIPSANNYSMIRKQVAVNHELSDGGRRVHVIDEKFKCKMSFEYVSSSFRDSLKDLYDSHDQLVFVPFEPTSAGVWDSICFPCQWHGAFDFYNLSDNAINAGHTGSITLLETPV